MDTMTLAVPDNRVARLAALLVALIALAWPPVARGQARPPTPRPLIPPDPSTRRPKAPPAAVPAPEAASQGDGPPINVTCVGTNAPAAVHVYALTPRAAGAEGAVAAAPGASPISFRYEWDFGDPAGRWNRLPGWNAAHVYDRPGQYTITLTVTDPAGKASRRTTWVRIAPDDRRRIYVSAEGNDGATGATPAQALRTPQHALQMARSNAQVLFRRGDTFDVGPMIGVNAQNVYVGNYDPRTPDGQPPAAGQTTAGPPPPLPVLRKVEGPPKQTGVFFVGTKARDLIFDGIEFDSQWPLNSQYGGGKVPARAFTVGGTNVTIRNCSFRNVTDAVNTELKPTGVLVQDNHFSNEIRGYCYWGNGTDHVVVGNVMLHSHQEHEIRCSEPGITRLLIAYNDLSRPSNLKGGIELREAHWFWVADNHIDGGTMRVGPQDDADVKRQIKNWAAIKCDWGVLEDNRFDRIWVHVRLGSEHIMVRNNTVRLDDGEWAYIVACDKPGFNEVRKALDITLEHNTATNNGTKGQFIFVQGRPAGLTIRDNLYVAPHIPAGSASGAIYTTDADLEGFDAVEGNVYPAGPGGTHHAAKAPVDRQQWATKPKVKDEKYADVQLDADDNPPPNVRAGARLGHDKRERDAKKAAEGKLNADYKAPGKAAPPPPPQQQK
jgi:hypothetical protein